jgi:riboflavin kinase/FMN adenylyltransferase
MQIIESFERIKKPFKNSVVTIGNFYGVHIGHQHLFKKVLEISDKIDGTAIVITFKPHPARVLKNSVHPLPLITLYEQKTELIASAGIDILICIPFTKEFASVSADSFIKNILVKQIGIKAIVIGRDYAFGKNREGNIDFLKKYQKALDFDVFVAESQKSETDEAKISSTFIREIVQKGEVEKATKALGRYYQIRGRVEQGRDRGGKLLGFPTANINLTDELNPKKGVYAVTVEIDKKIYKGVANIGFSPTFSDHIFTVEVHILDFSQNIYNKKIRVNFVSRLREEKKFNNIEELSKQIGNDILIARKILEK